MKFAINNMVFSVEPTTCKDCDAFVSWRNNCGWCNLLRKRVHNVGYVVQQKKQCDFIFAFVANHWQSKDYIFDCEINEIKTR